MKSQLSAATIAAFILTLPTAYFILIALLKYGLGVDAPFDASEPLFEQWGIKESLGWNINLLILFGPIVAFVLSILQVLKVEMNNLNERLLFQVTLLKKSIPLSVAAFSLLLLAILFIYLIGENCNC